MRLDLNSQERQYLDTVLTRYLSELNNEISHTDTREFRNRLKSEAEVLWGLKSKLKSEEDDRAIEGLA